MAVLQLTEDANATECHLPTQKKESSQLLGTNKAISSSLIQAIRYVQQGMQCSSHSAIVAASRINAKSDIQHV